MACCDEIPERAQEFAAKYAIPKVYTNIDEMLADPEIDAVSVCLPSGMHSDTVVRASNAGKHAMTEKPMDITLPKIDAMMNPNPMTGANQGLAVPAVRKRARHVMHRDGTKVVAFAQP